MNPLSAALRAGRFCYVVELVASALRREAQVLEAASRLAGLSQVVAGSITSYAGGAIGHDPIRVGTAARARGLTPNVHLTCVSQDRHALAKTLEDLHALGIENVFALTGDYPKTGPAAPVFDLDSVQLVRLIADLCRQGMSFHVAVAVSPFKYVEADWVSPALLERVRQESAGPDKGLGARLERAAHLVAVLRGLDYAGAYIGGIHDADQICWIIRRGEELAERWEELAEELNFGAPGGCYLYARASGPRAAAMGLRPTVAAATSAPASAPEGRASRAEAVPASGASTRLLPHLLDFAGRVAPVTRDTWLRRAFRALSAWADGRPRVAAGVERLELLVKRPLFGCQACGNCVLGLMEYVCPQTCPKQMRNGPCEGTSFGRCEVVDQPCIWGEVYERAKANHRLEGLRLYIPPPHRSLQGTSSWINYFLERDRRPR